MRITNADVSVADDENETAYFSSGSGKIIFSASDLAAQSACWNCRGISVTCALPVRAPSASGLYHLFSIYCGARCPTLARARAWARAKARAQAKAAADLLLGVDAQWQAARGSGALATYVEDNDIYDIHGEYIASVAYDDYEYEHGADEEEDEEDDEQVGAHCPTHLHPWR